MNNGNFLGCMPGSATAALSILTTGLFENTISLSNVTFDRNFAGNKGCDDGLFYGTLQGALSASGGTITIQSVKFLSNFLSPRGSRIGAGGGAWLTAHHVFLDGCIFQNNSVLGGESSFYSPGSQAAGGGMIGFATWEMSIVNTDFIDNIVVAGNSPIVYTAYASGAAGQPITLIKDKGAAYTAPIVRMGGYGYGGGLAAAELRSLNLLNVSFIGNSASGGTAHARGGLGLGGGLYVSNCEDVSDSLQLICLRTHRAHTFERKYAADCKRSAVYAEFRCRGRLSHSRRMGLGRRSFYEIGQSSTSQ